MITLPIRLKLPPIIKIDQKPNPLHKPNQPHHEYTPKQCDHSHRDIFERVVTWINHDTNPNYNENHSTYVCRQDEEELPWETVMIRTPECYVNLRVDILIMGFPEYFPILKSMQKFTDNLLKIDIQVTLKQMKNHNHVNHRKTHDHHSTQQIQNYNSVRYTVVVENSTFIVGHPGDQDEEWL